MYPCFQSHKHAFRTSVRHIHTFSIGKCSFRTRHIHVECFHVLVSELTGRQMILGATYKNNSVVFARLSEPCLNFLTKEIRVSFH